MKACTVCGLVLPLEQFARRNAMRDGHVSQCKACDRERNKAYRAKNPEKTKAALKQWRDANKENIAAYMKEWRSENIDRVKMNQRARYRANADRLRADMRAYAQQHKAEKQERNRAWAKANMEKISARSFERRELLRRLTSEDRDYMRILRSDPCGYCGSQGGSIDHITALSEGGEGGWTNLTASCGSCNPSKGTDDLLGFLRRRTTERTISV